MKATIIYHKVDLNGVASAAIAKSYYENQDGTTQIALCPYTYGDSMDEFKKEAEDSQVICVLDVSFGEDTFSMMKDWIERGKGVLWIDHHKGILEEAESWSIHIPGKREIGIAACELTYNHFNGHAPMIIKHLSAYDVWNKNMFDWEDVMNIQYAMRAEIGLDVYKMQKFIDNIDFYDEVGQLSELKAKGKSIRDFLTVKNQGEVENYSFIGKIDGKNALFMNTLEFNSTTFQSKTPEWLDGEAVKFLAPFAVQPNGLVRFSLYKTEGRFDVDCCEMAKRFGGGGHKGAAGFQVKTSDGRFVKFLESHEINSGLEKFDKERREEIIRLREFDSDYITDLDYFELADRFVHVHGWEKLGIKTIYDDTVRILNLTQPNLNYVFMNRDKYEEGMGDAFFNVEFIRDRKDGVVLEYGNRYPGKIRIPGDNEGKERCIFICGIKYENGCVVYTGDVADFVKVTQNWKGGTV